MGEGRREPDLSGEQELLKRMLAGDERAFDAFFETYFPRLYRFALPRLRRDEDATREVVQGTLIKAMRRLDTFRGDAALFTWLCQICRREIADHVRTLRRHDSRVVLLDDSEYRAMRATSAGPARRAAGRAPGASASGC